MLHRSLISIIATLIIGSGSIMANDVCTDNEPETVSTTGLQGIAAVNHKSDNPISRNIFLELGGPSIGIGIGYDRRFKPTSVLGFSAGLSYTSISWSDSGWFGAYKGTDYTDIDSKGVAILLEVNALFGKRASKLELGIGATPCIFNRHEVRYWGLSPENQETDVKDGTRINIFGSLNVGYRLQRKSGFFLRAGLSLLIGDIKCSPMDGVILMPHLSLGYTIR